ncbi:MAG: acyl-CoA dehydrogenase [Gemmatimonadetes bacterium]|nr:MAG: acyl-CoA dehydrogenase [Gemmatimonadota bacterium]TMG24901.1 MAG: acyl-CoA dehydrogenase [Chloroflexota bacterium]
MAEGLRSEVASRLDDALDRLRGLRLGLDAEEVYRPEVPAALVAAGLHTICLPVDAGGLGAGLKETAIGQAALGAIDGSAALGFAMHQHVLGSAVESASWPAQLRQRLFAAVRDEGALLNSAATEEGGGSPARGAIPATTARIDRETVVLRGEKTWTTWLPALRFALVTATLEGDRAAPADDEPVIGTFLVDLQLPGVFRRPSFDALGVRASASGTLGLEDVRVGLDDMIARRWPGEPDPRGPAPGAWFGVCIAATYLGVGEGARDDVTRWALGRRPGDGSASVADLPTVQVRLGKLDAALRVARTVLLDVAGRWDAAPPGDRSALLADIGLAKITATNAAVTATDEALRIAGGPGYLAGRLERAFRDARAGLINPPLDDIAYQSYAKALIERTEAQAREGH